MIEFILRNNLYLMAALVVMIAAFVAVSWASMPVLQRMVGLFFVGLVLHLWEEGRFPGGFVEMTRKGHDFSQRLRLRVAKTRSDLKYSAPGLLISINAGYLQTRANPTDDASASAGRVAPCASHSQTHPAPRPWNSRCSIKRGASSLTPASSPAFLRIRSTA
jgi:hypothetical protein